MKTLQTLESNIWRVIVEKYNIDVSEEVTSYVKDIDKGILKTERDILLPKGPEFETTKGFEKIEIDAITLGWHPSFAEESFLKMFKYFTKERRELCQG